MERIGSGVITAAATPAANSTAEPAKYSRLFLTYRTKCGSAINLCGRRRAKVA